MNITSYNVNDVTFHYVGLRVLQASPNNADKATQIATISKNIYNHICHRSLRLMLPEPKGSYRVAGKKVCQELMHFGLICAEKGMPYRLTDSGLSTLALLEERRYTDLRKVMAELHLNTYDNLRAVLLHHLDGTSVWRPVVEERRLAEAGYVSRLLAPTFGEKAKSLGDPRANLTDRRRTKSIESDLTSLVLSYLFGAKMKNALFRTLCDRLASLRLLNARRADKDDCAFTKTYSPCRSTDDEKLSWYTPLETAACGGSARTIYVCEPDMERLDCQDVVLGALDEAFERLPAAGGYHAIPDLRDFVCERLMIPEPAFDDAVNRLLDRTAPVLSAGLGYEGITAQRKPLVRKRGETQLHNLLRRVR